MLPFITKQHFKYISLFLVFSLLYACGTFKEQQSGTLTEITPSSENPTHTFFIAGGLGTSETNSNQAVIERLQNDLSKASKKSTLIFPGDYLTEDPSNEALNKALLEKHLALAKTFKGKTYFVPGDHEWSAANTDQIEWVEDYIKDNDLKNIEVEPNNVCP